MIKKFNTSGGNILLWLCIVAFLAILYGLFLDPNLNNEHLTFSDFMSKVDSGGIKKVAIRGNMVIGEDQNGRPFDTLVPPFYPKMMDALLEKDIKVEIKPIETPMGSVVSILLQWFPVLLLAGVWIYFMRNVQGGGKAMGFGRSKARLIENTSTCTFADVAGVDEAKEELQEIVDFLKDPAKFQRLGGKIPKGCLLVGPPGTGKTLLARAVAGEAGVPFFSISGSDFVEMFVGVGASRVRDMFTLAKKSQPCIVFIDEIDAVGRHRGVGMGGGNDEREQTLNQLLVEMDGFSPNEGVIVIAATNRADVLDRALLRPGRFDRQISVSPPDVNGRRQIIKVHLEKVPVGPDVDINVLAKGTPGFVGADLANLINEGALAAARINLGYVTMEILEKAKDKVMMGGERRSMLMSEREKQITAYHEAGHALIALHMPESDPLYKVTIVPRNNGALGFTVRLPEDNRYAISRATLYADLAVAMGGRVAEGLIFGPDQVTTGASGDIKMASNIARKMVMEWGLSDKIGMLYIDNEEGSYFAKGGNNAKVSDTMAQEADKEVKRIIDESYAKATSIISENIDELHLIAKGLLEYETLTAEEVKAILDGKKIRETRAGNTSDSGS